MKVKAYESRKYDGVYVSIPVREWEHLSVEGLIEIGKALYGPRWKTELARAMKIRVGILTGWISDPEKYPIDEFKTNEIQDLIDDHIEALLKAREHCHEEKRLMSIYSFKTPPLITSAPKRKR